MAGQSLCGPWSPLDRIGRPTSQSWVGFVAGEHPFVIAINGSPKTEQFPAASSYLCGDLVISDLKGLDLAPKSDRVVTTARRVLWARVLALPVETPRGRWLIHDRAWPCAHTGQLPKVVRAGHMWGPQLTGVWGPDRTGVVGETEQV